MAANNREVIDGVDVDMNDNGNVVLTGIPMTKWGDPNLVPAGNAELLRIAGRHIGRLRWTQMRGTAMALEILNDPSVRGTMRFLVHLNDQGQKVRLAVNRDAWQSRDLTVFRSPDDNATLKKWLKQPLDTFMGVRGASGDNVQEGDPEPEPEEEPIAAPPNGSIQTATNVICMLLQDTIANARGSLTDMKARVFNNRDLEYGCLKALEDAQANWDKAVWSRRWAGKLQLQDQEALDHSDRRRTLLFFLRKVCDLGLTEEGGIVEGQLEALQSLAHILTRIYEVVIPMDRANALYCLHNTATRGPGNHWYALEHFQRMVDVGAVPPNYTDKHTMNRRYLFMLRSAVISDFDRERLMTLLTPTLSPNIPLDPDTILRAEADGMLVLQDLPDNEFLADFDQHGQNIANV